MTIQEFINSNPTKEKVADILCTIANNNVLPINELWCYEELTEKFNLSMNDFYDDQDELTEYERNCIGLYNWKHHLKED